MEITANSLHPGAIATNLFRQSNIMNGTYLMNVVLTFMCFFGIFGLKIGHLHCEMSMQACSIVTYGETV